MQIHAAEGLGSMKEGSGMTFQTGQSKSANKTAFHYLCLLTI
jgi:hypothetical protein